MFGHRVISAIKKINFQSSGYQVVLFSFIVSLMDIALSHYTDGQITVGHAKQRAGKLPLFIYLFIASRSMNSSAL